MSDKLTKKELKERNRIITGITDILTKDYKNETEVYLQGCHDLVEYVLSETERERKRVLELISKNEGWEETRDFYAKKLGIKPKYV